MYAYVYVHVRLARRAYMCGRRLINSQECADTVSALTSRYCMRKSVMTSPSFGGTLHSTNADVSLRLETVGVSGTTMTSPPDNQQNMIAINNGLR